jgi:hypothetical protein
MDDARPSLMDADDALVLPPFAVVRDRPRACAEAAG